MGHEMALIRTAFSHLPWQERPSIVAQVWAAIISIAARRAGLPPAGVKGDAFGAVVLTFEPLLGGARGGRPRATVRIDEAGFIDALVERPSSVGGGPMWHVERTPVAVCRAVAEIRALLGAGAWSSPAPARQSLRVLPGGRSGPAATGLRPRGST